MSLYVGISYRLIQEDMMENENIFKIYTDNDGIRWYT